MANQKQPKALIMSETEWEKNKQWLLQFPGVFCNPVIEQLERYLLPLPPAPLHPSPLVSEEDKVGLKPDRSSQNRDKK
tara:strand:+ start:1585 stop:1818 length:234 start_codon:yes stop_codon:yes gene_type:complete